MPDTVGVYGPEAVPSPPWSTGWRTADSIRRASERAEEELLEAFGSGWELGWNLRDTAEEVFRHMPEERPDAGPKDVAPWEMRIGLSKFYVPPINIDVQQIYKAGALTGGALRHQSAPKFNTGHKETVITMTLYFPNYESIWGVEDQLLRLQFDSIDAGDGPLDSWDPRRNPQPASSDAVIDRFMSTLRGLIAQFRYAPFLPIRNAYLNKVFNITGVTMKDMSVSTVPNFPNCLAVQLVMYKFNHKTYLPMIDHFDQAIHWGRLRSYLGRAVARLAQASHPIQAWDENNSIMNSSRDLGEVRPSIVRASDYIRDNQLGEVPSGHTFRRFTYEDVDDFELYFPLHTPHRIDIPSTAFIDDRHLARDDSGWIPESWWQRQMSRLGVNIDLNPEARYDAARETAENMGRTYVSPGNTGLTGLMNWLSSYGYTIEHMSSANLSQYIAEHTTQYGIRPGTPAYDREAAEIRRIWFYHLYRTMMEDPYLANMLSTQDRRARQMTINEWELPMFPLDMDKSAYKVVGISASIGNVIARHQLQMEDEPTHQHIGGADSRLDIAMVFTGPKAEQELTRLRMMMDQISGLARLEQGHGVLGFLGIKSVLASLFGFRYVVPVGFDVNTIPNQPSSYNVNLSFVDFDIFQQKREQLDPSQQAHMAQQFGKRNPFLRVKQLWSMFNAYPDFPLGVHDGGGKLVGYLDPDYYFRSFDVIDDDIVDPGPPSSGADSVTWGGWDVVRGAPSNSDTDPNLDPVELIAGAIPIRINFPQVLGTDGTPIAPAIDIDPDEQGTIHFLEDGHHVDEESRLGYVMGEETTAASLNAPAMIEGAMPAASHQSPMLFGTDNPATQFYSMAHDMQYRDKSGRMVRAFPTYMLWLIDEAGFGYGVRLFDNFYGLQSVIDFSVVQSDEPLNDTLVLRVSNLYSKLSTKFHDYLEETGKNERTARIVNSFTEKYHRMLTGLSDDYIAVLNTIELKPGVRVHLRAGYSANPNRLETIFNGTITEVEQGEVLTIVAQSDAMELSALVDTENEEASSGKIDGSMSGLWLSEPRDLMVTLLSEGASRTKEFLAWATRGDIFSENRYGIKHFGMMLYTYMDGEERRMDGVRRDTVADVMTRYQEGMIEEAAALGEPLEGADAYGTGIIGTDYSNLGALRALMLMGIVNRRATRDIEIFKRNIYPGNGLGIAQYLGGDLDELGIASVLNEGQQVDEDESSEGYEAYNTIESARHAHLGGSVNITPRPSDSATEMGLRSAPTGRVDRQTYRRPPERGRTFPGSRNLLEIMGITNPQDEDGPFDEVAFRANVYMKTVWDMFETCAALLPNYIVAVRPFEDRSTVFYGKPHWLYTSGVIPVTQGSYAEDGIPIARPDEEAQELLDRFNAIQQEHDQASSIENFFNEISFWEANNLETPASRLPDPSTARSPTYVGSTEGADLAAEVAYQAGFRGDDLVIMVAIAAEESSWNPNTHNYNPSTGDDSYGLWQINMLGNLGPSRRRQFGITRDSELLDPLVNARAAKTLSDARQAWEGRPDSRFRDWSVYLSGIYRDGQGNHRESMSLARQAVSRFMASIGSGSPVAERSGTSSQEYDPRYAVTGGRPPSSATDDEEYDPRYAVVGGRPPASASEDEEYDSRYAVIGGQRPVLLAEDLLSGTSEDFQEIFLKVVGSTKSAHQIGQILAEFDENFLGHEDLELSLKVSRLLAPLNETQKQQVSDSILAEVGQRFVDWIKSNPYAYGWVVRVANARGNPVTGSLLRMDNWDFSDTYTAFSVYCSYGIKATEDYMKANLDAGRRNAGLLPSIFNYITDTEWREEADLLPQALGFVGLAISGVTSLIRLSLLSLTEGLSMATDIQKQTNVLNRMLNDSIYFNAGRDDRGNITNSLLNAADNPFTREYGEPVVEIREPFSRMHTLGSFQHIIHNGIIQSLDDVATTITATSNDGETVTVHFDKGLPAERQVERTVDTGLYWDEPTGWLGLKRLRHPIQALRSRSRRYARGWSRTSDGISSEISSKRVALYHLKKSLETLYRGELTIIGDASIRPHDMVYLMDVYSRMYGLVNIKQVVHHMTPEMGFVTQVTPAMPVFINDPARWNIQARWKGSLAAHALRETARRILIDDEDKVANLRAQYGVDGRNMSIDDLVEVFDDQIQGSLQYTEGVGSIIGDYLAKGVSGNVVQRIDREGLVSGIPTAGIPNPLNIPYHVTSFLEKWGPFKWWRDNILDQHGCYVDFLTKNGSPMDGSLSYAQGMAVGHPREKSLIIGGLKLMSLPVIYGDEGSRIIRTEDVVPQIRWRETDGLTNQAKQISLFHDATLSRVRDLAYSGEFLSNFASEVYWVRITNIVDADTFDIEVLGHAPNGVYQRNTNLTVGQGDNVNRLRLFGSDAAEDDYQHTSELIRQTAYQAGDVGVRATEWVKQKLAGQEVNYLAAIRLIKPNSTDQFDRGLAYMFINAPEGYWSEKDPTNQQKRREYLLNAAGRIPVKAWDSYTDDGRPHTLDWDLVTRGFAHVYSNDLRAIQPGRGARG